MFYNQPPGMPQQGMMPPYPNGGYPQQMTPQQWQQMQQQQMMQQQWQQQQLMQQQQMMQQRGWQQPRAVPNQYPGQMGYPGYPPQMQQPMPQMGMGNVFHGQQPWTSGNLDGRSVGSGFSKYSSGNNNPQPQPGPWPTPASHRLQNQSMGQGMSVSERYLATVPEDRLPASVRGAQSQTVSDTRPVVNQPQQAESQALNEARMRVWAEMKREDDEKHLRRVAAISGMSEKEYDEYMEKDTDDDVEEDFDPFERQQEFNRRVDTLMQKQPMSEPAEQSTYQPVQSEVPRRVIPIETRKKRKFVLVNSIDQRGEIADKKDFMSTPRKPYITAPNTTYQALAKTTAKTADGVVTVYEPISSEEGLTEEELDRGRHYINKASLALKEAHPIKAQTAEVQVLQGDQMVSAPERKKEVIQDRASNAIVHETEGELSITEAILNTKYLHKVSTTRGDGVYTVVKTDLRRYFIAKQSMAEIVSKLSETTTFKELQLEINRLLANNDPDVVEFTAQLDRYLTQELEKLIHIKMGLYGISFGSFADDAVDLIRHIEGKFGPTYSRALTGYQETFIKSLLVPSILNMDESVTDESTKYYGVGIKKKMLIAYVDIDADSLNVGTVDRVALLISNATLPNLYDFVKELFKKSPGVYTHYIVTNDERIFEINKGLIDAGSEIPTYLINEVTLCH